MTGSTRWIACFVILSFLLFLQGCSPSPSRASAPANFDAITAASLEQLDRSSGAAADTIKSIDLARDVVLNNVRNADTNAFKKSRALMQEGGKVKTELDFTQGSLNNTGRPLDVGIQGEGFFKVKVANNLGNGIAYTRNGNFFINNAGELVAGMGDGYKLMPEVKIPTGVASVTIENDGVITGIKPGGSSPTPIGQMKLTQFVNPEGLTPIGQSLYQESAASGPPIDSNPGDQGSGTLLQNFLEQSNVDLTSEMIRLHYLERWCAAMLEAMGMPAEKI